MGSNCNSHGSSFAVGSFHPCASDASLSGLANDVTAPLANASTDCSTGKSLNDAAYLNEPQTMQQQSMRKLSPNDFIFYEIIGEGSFSTVFRAEEVSTNRHFAVKVCEKRVIKRERKVAYVTRERDVMRLLTQHTHPLFVRLYCTFQDDDRLYFVMTLARKGELLTMLKKLSVFDMEVTRFYAAEIVLALQHLHKLGIVHRDLKPENILLNEDMHIRISDFGSAKLIKQIDDVLMDSESDRPTPLLPKSIQSAQINSPNKRSSFVGTAQYVSPEVLTSQACTESCDLWALGCIIYQMLAGLPPFRDANDYLIFQRIMKLNYTFPEGFAPVARDLIEKLILSDPNLRLGNEANGGFSSLRAHPFFEGISDWDTLPDRRPPTILPYLPATSEAEQGYHGQLVPALGDNLSSSELPKQTGLSDSRMIDLMGIAKEFANINKDCVQIDHSDVDTSVSIQDRKRRLQEQEKNPYHRFVEGNLIIKSGLMDKRRGLFARTRMFLLTEGPHLYYVDPANMDLKGQVPWSKDLRTEVKNFKIFFVHTPNRTYYLIDQSGHALSWCEAIEKVKKIYFR